MVSGELLREARLRAGLTQAELAERAGTARSQVSRYERGHVVGTKIVGGQPSPGDEVVWLAP